MKCGYFVYCRRVRELEDMASRGLAAAIKDHLRNGSTFRELTSKMEAKQVLSGATKSLRARKPRCLVLYPSPSNLLLVKPIFLSSQ